MPQLIRPMLLLFAGCALLTAADSFTKPASGEHPRLFFRVSDLPEIKARAQTPEGKQIVKRLRFLLNGGDGESLPAKFNPDRESKDSAGMMHKETPSGQIFTLWHGAGYGMLYQITGEQKYADLGRKSVEMAMEGQRDRDHRYSFRNPHGALRAGPSLSAIAMAYDLCYGGWDEAFRKQVAQAIQNYNEGQYESIEELTKGARHSPGSNHWGPQVGGAAIALLAIRDDPGVDADKIEALIERNKQSMVKQLTSGMGNRGYFSEHIGAGQIASDTAFVPALQAYRVAAGIDYAEKHDSALWLALRWALLPIQRGDEVYYVNPVTASSYGHTYFQRNGLSRGGHFSQGFGIAPKKYHPALLWVYHNIIAPGEGAVHGDFAGMKPGENSYDTVSHYPHRAVLALVNWPIGVEPANPAGTVPNAIYDTMHKWLVVRDRWQDENDFVLGLMRGIHQSGYFGEEETLRLWAGGKRYGGELGGATPKGGRQGDSIVLTEDGSALLTTAQEALLVDRSGASGADVLVALRGGTLTREYDGPDPYPVVPPEKVNLTGSWGEVTIEQSGNKLLITNKAQKGWLTATGTIDGYKLQAVFHLKKKEVPLAGNLDPNAKIIVWDNSTTWHHDDYKAPEVGKVVYQAGDMIKHLPMPQGAPFALFSIAYDGQHPADPKVDGNTITVGGQTITLQSDGSLELGKKASVAGQHGRK